MAQTSKHKTGFRQDEEYKRFEMLLKKRGAVDALPAFLKAFNSVRLGGFVRAKKLLADSGCDDSVEDCMRDFVVAKGKLAEAGFDKSLAAFVEYSLSLVMPKGIPITFEGLHSLWLEARREE
jgi:hypothetical protein